MLRVRWRLFPSMAAGVASAFFSCFRLGFIIKLDLAQHGAPAALVDEVGPRLVVVFPDGRHDGDDLSVVRRPQDTQVLADWDGALSLVVGSGIFTGATERPSNALDGHFLACGWDGCQGPRGAGRGGRLALTYVNCYRELSRVGG